jgi:hypothetical protein
MALSTIIIPTPHFTLSTNKTNRREAAAEPPVRGL